jgi:hypothetical protein
MRTKYLLDTNVFIEAYRTYYAFDLAPSFWKILSVKSKTDDFAVIDKVRKELAAKEDSLNNWFTQNYEGEVLSSNNSAVITAYSNIITKTEANTKYLQKAKDEFAEFDRADAWIISHATILHAVIVTAETAYRPDCKNRVLIPNVCKEEGVTCINFFDFMRKNKFSF